MINWKSFLFSGLTLFVVFCASNAFAQQCYDIYLRDGTVIEGVQCKTEELWGVKYLVYRFCGHNSINRIEYKKIKTLTEAKCKSVPTPTPQPVQQNLESQSFVKSTHCAEYLRKLSVSEIKEIGFSKYVLHTPYHIEIQFDESIWNIIPHDDKLQMVRLLENSWKDACKKDGVGLGIITFKGFRSGRRLADLGWHGEWTIAK